MVIVPSMHTAREAFAVLTSAGVSGVPVVDIAGAIVANFSVSDVRHLARITNQADAETALALPVLEYLARCVSVGMCYSWCTRGDHMLLDEADDRKGCGVAVGILVG